MVTMGAGRGSGSIHRPSELRRLERYRQALAGTQASAASPARLLALAGRRRTHPTGDVLAALGLPVGPDARAAMQALEDACLAAPVMASPLSPDASFGLHMTYRLVLPPVTPDGDRSVEDEVRWLHPRLWQPPSRLLGRPDLWLDHRPELLALDRFLRSPHRPATLRERAYELFGDEKALEAAGTGVPELLRQLGSRAPHSDLLDARPTRIPSFPSFVLSPGGTVLVSENDDFYHSLNVACRRGGGQVLLAGKLVSGAILGSGKRVLMPSEHDGPPGSALVTFLETQSLPMGRLSYVGDIDPEGIGIQQALEDATGIPPATGVYALMADAWAERRRDGLPTPQTTSAGQSFPFDLGRFLAILPEDRQREAVTCAVARGNRVPQEIVSLGVMLGGRHG